MTASDLIKKLWQEKKWLLILLIPVLLILLFSEVLLSLIKGSADRIVRKATEKDKALEEQINAAKRKADLAKSKADAAKKKRQNIKGDKNWHKKRKRS